MRLTDPRLLDRLAAEYVLGTLRGGARRRFEQELAPGSPARAAVDRWESRLAAWAARFEPVQPRAQTWPALALRLGLASGRQPARRIARLWPALAMAAALAVIAVGLALRSAYDPQRFRAAAVVAQTDGRPLWQVDLAAAGDALRVTVIGEVRTPTDKDFELWALPEGGAPVSLGLLPAHGRTAYALSGAQRRALAAARRIAVSIEPRGGSTTGAPSGPVVHVAPLRLAAGEASRASTAG